MRIGYCPNCATEIMPEDIEVFTEDIIWGPCRNHKCRISNVSIKSDKDGFVMEPANYKGRYIFSRPEPREG